MPLGCRARRPGVANVWIQDHMQDPMASRACFPRSHIQVVQRLSRAPRPAPG